MNVRALFTATLAPIALAACGGSGTDMDPQMPNQARLFSAAQTNETNLLAGPAASADIVSAFNDLNIGGVAASVVPPVTVTMTGGITMTRGTGDSIQQFVNADVTAAPRQDGTSWTIRLSDHSAADGTGATLPISVVSPAPIGVRLNTNGPGTFTLTGSEIYNIDGSTATYMLGGGGAFLDGDTTAAIGTLNGLVDGATALGGIIYMEE